METLNTVIEFVSSGTGGGTGADDAAATAGATGSSATADPLFTIIAVLIAIAAIGISIFVYARRNKIASASAMAAQARPSINSQGLHGNNLARGTKFLTATIAVILAATCFAIFGHNNALATEGSATNGDIATITDKVQANVDDAGAVTFDKGVIKNNDKVLAIGVRHVAADTDVDLSDATLQITCNDKELYNKPLSEKSQLNDEYVTVDVDDSAYLNYSIKMPADKAKELVGTSPVTLGTTVDLVCQKNGQLKTSTGEEIKTKGTVTFTYTDPYTEEEVIQTIETNEDGSYETPNFQKGQQVDISISYEYDGRKVIINEPLTFNDNTDIPKPDPSQEKKSPKDGDVNITMPSSEGAIYSREAKAATFTIASGAPEQTSDVTLEYQKQGSTEWTSQAPKEAGTYSVRANVAEGAYCTAGVLTNDSWTFEITQKQLTVSGTTADNKEYDGYTTATTKLGTVEGICTGDTVTISVTGEFKKENAGNDKTVDLTYQMDGKDSNNYLRPVDDTCTANITKRNMSYVTITLGAAPVYNEQEQTITFTATDGNPSILSTDDYTVDGDKATNAGQYPLTLTAKDFGNYTGTKSTLWTLKKASNPHAEAPSSDLFDLETPTLKGKPDAKITFSSAGTGTDGYEYKASTASDWTQVTGGATEIANLAAGTYEIRYQGDGNHEASAALTLTIEDGATTTFTYDANGATGTPPASETDLSYGDEVTLSDNTGLTKTDYEFIGWNTLTEGGTDTHYDVGSKYVVKEANPKLFAEWKLSFYSGAVKAIDSPGASAVEKEGIKVKFEPSDSSIQTVEATTVNNGKYTLNGIVAGTSGKLSVIAGSDGTPYTPETTNVAAGHSSTLEVITTTKLTSLQTTISESWNGSLTQRAACWCPVIQDDAPLASSIIKFYDYNRELISDKRADGTDGYSMKDIASTTKTSAAKGEAYKTQANYFAFCKTGQTINCFQTVGMPWTTAFTRNDTSTEGVADSLKIDTIKERFTNKNDSFKTVYKNGDTWETEWGNWSTTPTVAPKVLNYKYSRKGDSDSTPNLVDIYGNVEIDGSYYDESKILSSQAYYPWSARSVDSDGAYTWKSVYGKWTSYSKESRDNAVVVQQAFTS